MSSQNTQFIGKFAGAAKTAGGASKSVKNLKTGSSRSSSKTETTKEQFQTFTSSVKSLSKVEPIDVPTWKPPSRIWKWFGFTPKLSRQNGFGATGLEFTSFLAQLQADLITVFRIPINIIYAIANWIISLIKTLLITGPGGIPIILIIVWLFFLFYLMQIFWPLIIALIVDFVTPLLNVMIEVFNFVFEITILLLRIVFQIWNIFVPFIGMILYIVIDLVVTIFRAVMDVLGSIDIMPIIQALLEIMFFIIDIVMQILMVMIEVQMAVLEIISEVIGFILELLFTAIRIWMDILVWIIDLLFKILEPILVIVQVIAAAFSWMLGGGKKVMAGRKLLSMGIAGLLLNGSPVPEHGNLFGQQEMSEDDQEMTIPPYEDYVRSVYDNFRDYVQTNTSSRILKDRYHLHLDNPDATEQKIQENIAQRKNVGKRSAFSTNNNKKEYNSGRQLFQYQGSETFDRKPGIQFEDDPGDHLDQTTATFMHHFHSGVKKMVQEGTDFDLMHETMERIKNHWRSPDRLSIRSILNRFNREHAHLARVSGKGPASVRYQNIPEHPRDMHVRFHENRKAYAKRNSVPHQYTVNAAKHLGKFKRPGGGGRSLLQHPHGASEWDDSQRVHIETLATMEREHARQIVKQERVYYGHHVQKIKTARVIHKAARENILKHATTTFHADNVFNHFSNILKRFGYHSPWDVYNHFIETHGDAAAFVLSLSAMTEHPLIKYWKEKDPARDERPFFHDWHTQQQELAKMRTSRSGNGVGRKLLQDEGVGNEGNSQEKFDGLEIISKTDCYSSPRNPLCMPEIPESFSWSLPTVTWPDDIKDDSDVCPPWRMTKCLVCLDRYHNAFQSLRFIISGFPPFNFALTVFCELIPFLSWMVDWAFLIPKGEVVGLREVLCFIIHIYDLIVFFVTLWAIGFFLFPIINALLIIPWRNCVHSWYGNRELESEWDAQSQYDPHMENLFYHMIEQGRRVPSLGPGPIASVLEKMGGHVNQHQSNVFNIYHTPTNHTSGNRRETHEQAFVRITSEYAKSLAESALKQKKLKQLLELIGKDMNLNISTNRQDVLTTINHISSTHPMLNKNNDESNVINRV